MGSTWSIDENDSYEQTMLWARLRIDEDRAVGGARLAAAPFHARLLDEHVTASQRKGDTCASCAEAWPCGVIRSLFESD